MAALCEEGKLNPELLQVSLDAMTCRHVAGVKPRTDRDTAISNAVESAMKVIQCLPTSPSSKTRVCINSVPGGMKHLVASTLAKRLGSTVFVAEELAAVYKAYKRLGFEGFAGSDGELYSFKNPDALQVHLVHHLKFDTGEHFQDFATAAAESNGSEDMLNLLCLQTSGFYRGREDITSVHPELPVCARLMRTTYSDHSRPATSKDKVKMLTGLGVLDRAVI